jgi:hypothetical protein
LEIADDAGKRMRPDHRAEDVVRRLDAGHPVPHGLVDRVAQRPRTAGYRPHLGTQQLHAEHVGRLTAHVLLAHVDHARQTEMGASGRGGHAVLPGSGLGDHPLLAHPQRQQGLAQGVVDLVRAGMVDVLALEPDLGTAALLAQPPGVIQGRGPADEVPQQFAQRGTERRILNGPLVLVRQLVQGPRQRFRDIASAVIAEAARRIGHVAGCIARKHGRSGHTTLDGK